jgi:hypothetical protein
MPRSRSLLASLSLAVLLPTIGSSQAPKTAKPKLEAIAETKLLMDGMTHPNFKAIDRFLKEPTDDVEAWLFARGQALLIAETGNLLMLRPPKNAVAEETWMARTTELRDSGTKLAAALTARELAKSRVAQVALANSCNRCHESFRVEARVKVSGDGKE